MSNYQYYDYIMIITKTKTMSMKNTYYDDQDNGSDQ